MSRNDTFAAEWQAVRAALLQHADGLAYDAGMSGAFHDGGAAALRARIEAFDAGVAHRIPDEWRRIVAPRLDPEYATYLRLQAKFKR